MFKRIIIILLLGPALVSADSADVSRKFCEYASTNRMAELVLFYQDPQIREKSDLNKQLQANFDRIAMKFRCKKTGIVRETQGGIQFDVEAGVDTPHTQPESNTRTIYLNTQSQIVYDPFWVHHPAGLDSLVAAVNLESSSSERQNESIKKLSQISAPVQAYRSGMSRPELAALKNAIIEWWNNSDSLRDANGIILSKSDKEYASQKFQEFQPHLSEIIDKEYEILERGTKGITRNGSGQQTAK